MFKTTFSLAVLCAAACASLSAQSVSTAQINGTIQDSSGLAVPGAELPHVHRLRTLADSTAICHYLERRHPMPALFPSTAEDYGRMVWFEEFSDTVLVPAAGKVFFNLVVKPRFFKQPADMAVVDKALADDLPPLFDYLEGASTLEDFLEDFPSISRETAISVLEAARARLAEDATAA